MSSLHPAEGSNTTRKPIVAICGVDGDLCGGGVDLAGQAGHHLTPDTYRHTWLGLARVPIAFNDLLWPVLTLPGQHRSRRGATPDRHIV